MNACTVLLDLLTTVGALLLALAVGLLAGWLVASSSKEPGADR